MADVSDENYIEAMKVVVDQTKGVIAISGVPLALLLSQMRLLLANQSVWISLLLTIATLSLFIATFLSWYSAQFAQTVLATEIFERDGKKPQKGRLYMAFIKDLTKRDDFIYTEKGFIALSRKTVVPTVLLLFVGYFSLMLLLLTLIWVAP